VNSPRQLATLRLALLVTDAVSAIILFALVSALRFGPDFEDVWTGLGFDWWVFATGFAVAWIGAEWLFELDKPRTRWGLRSEAADIARAVVVLVIIVFSALFVVKIPDISRQFLIMLFAAQATVAVVGRVVLWRLLIMLRVRGVGTRHMLVVGAGATAQEYADRFERNRELGFRVVGHLGTAGEVTRPVLGPLEALEDVIHSRVVDDLLVCLDPDDIALLGPVLSLGQEEGKVVRLPVGASTAFVGRGRLESLDGVPILSITNSPDRVVGLLGKRLLDVGLSAAALVLLSPLILVVAVLIRLQDRGPVLFRQTRMGLHGRPFTILKFRTMVPDAEAQLADLFAANEIDGPAFKLSDDPRVTRVGRALRRTSLDELPQFWNVLRGQMSVVGPRPPLPQEVAGYDLWHRRRLSMKPGMTGLWQVSARRIEDFDHWVELDLSYIDRWSFWLDLKIMVRTVPAMLNGR
jgi:exopolysaccharide biosynthesis polyprenyl glycosylphosphotransferase